MAPGEKALVPEVEQGQLWWLYRPVTSGAQTSFQRLKPTPKSSGPILRGGEMALLTVEND